MSQSITIASKSLLIFLSVSVLSNSSRWMAIRYREWTWYCLNPTSHVLKSSRISCVGWNRCDWDYWFVNIVNLLIDFQTFWPTGPILYTEVVQDNPLRHAPYLRYDLHTHTRIHRQTWTTQYTTPKYPRTTPRGGAKSFTVEYCLIYFLISVLETPTS